MKKSDRDFKGTKEYKRTGGVQISNKFKVTTYRACFLTYTSPVGWLLLTLYSSNYYTYFLK